MKQKKLIEGGYLSGLVFSSVAIIFVGTVLSALVLYFEIYRPLDAHYGNIISTVTEIKESLIMKSLTISGIFSLLTGIGLLFLVIFYTHGIAGPLHRIKASARSIGEGDLGTKIKLRRRDVIHPFAESLADMAGSYLNRVQSLREEVRLFREAVTDLKSAAEEGKETVSELRKTIDKDKRIKKALDSVRL